MSASRPAAISVPGESIPHATYAAIGQSEKVANASPFELLRLAFDANNFRYLESDFTKLDIEWGNGRRPPLGDPPSAPCENLIRRSSRYDVENQPTARRVRTFHHDGGEQIEPLSRVGGNVQQHYRTDGLLIRDVR